MKGRINAGDICTRIVTIAYPSMAVNEAARLMREQHVGSLVAAAGIGVIVNAGIVMLTGYLNSFRTDAEIATVQLRDAAREMMAAKLKEP